MDETIKLRSAIECKIVYRPKHKDNDPHFIMKHHLN